jgi:hypothetical protein
MNDTRLHRLNGFTNDGMDAVRSMVAALAPLMVGIRRQPAPPLRFGAQRLHRMHVLVMQPQHEFETRSRADDMDQVLPRLDCWPTEAQARPVLGEILRGEQGDWYERIGNRIRPLRQLAAGPSGEVLEVPKGYMFNRVASTQTTDEEPADEERQQEETIAEERLREGPAFTAFRSLVTGPGIWRVVPFGFFKSILAAQLSHPDRLRDSHRIPCHVEIFEAIAAQRIDALARAILGDSAGPTELQPLTPALVAQLELAQLLPAPSRVPPYSPEQGPVRPGQRFFRLRIANDPTAQAPASNGSAASATQLNSIPSDGTQSATPSRVVSIPVQLLRPWEYCRSREEATALLLRGYSLWARLTRPLRRLIHRRAFRQWQLLLSGRSADEQLWSISPPRGWLGDPWLREWARHTLELGGYDSAVLLSEWEIFWGRKLRP